MNIGVLGAGNGGVAVAAEWSLKGFPVYLFDFKAFSTQIEAIARQGGIQTSGKLSGFAPVSYAGHDLNTVMEHCDLIFVVGPAYSTAPFARACQPLLRKGHKFIVCPASCLGAIVFKKHLGIDLDNPEYPVADTSTLPYACRMTAPGQLMVYHRLIDGMFLSAVCPSNTPEMLALFATVYPIREAKNVLQTTLQNGNPVIHPVVSLLNAGRIESTEGDFFFYEDGVTPGVGRLMAAIDQERVQVGAALGLDILLDADLGVLQGYMQNNDYETGYRTAEGFKGIKAQGLLDHRYINEDVGYGLVLISDLAKEVGVNTPVIDSMILMASAMMTRNYREENPNRWSQLGVDLSILNPAQTTATVR